MFDFSLKDQLARVLFGASMQPGVMSYFQRQLMHFNLSQLDDRLCCELNRFPVKVVTISRMPQCHGPPRLLIGH